MELGCFSISLTVKDIKKSLAFYEQIGFKIYAGDIKQNFLILKNGNTNIGLFQGMFDNNIMTFNPGWDQDANSIDNFADVRNLKQDFEQQGIEIAHQSINSENGPASFSIKDPDGNMILFDQHV
ncbi:VOC family protein [Thalassotalea crassostreae]|uniref:VOC family protein n=1 Tax=Thalassotalea crassostreae TaxID=1763536 RepID=UPI0008382362|nr:VOC family protein [Thalassotalea crassostreae]